MGKAHSKQRNTGNRVQHLVQVIPDHPPFLKPPVAKDIVASNHGFAKWKTAKVPCVGACDLRARASV